MGSVSELCVSSFQAFLCPTIPRSPPGKSWLIFHGVVIITNMFSIDSVVNHNYCCSSLCSYLKQLDLPFFDWPVIKNTLKEGHEIKISYRLGVRIF